MYKPKLSLIATALALSLLSAHAAAKLQANDDTNKIEGVNDSTMMRTDDGGKPGGSLMGWTLTGNIRMPMLKKHNLPI